MADHSKPTITSTYSNFVTELDSRFDDLAVGLDPAVTTATNIPTNTLRWSSVANKWQKWNGSVWNDASSSYDIPVKFTPSGNLSSTTVQAAIAELDSEKLTNNAVAARSTLGLANHQLVAVDTSGKLTLPMTGADVVTSYFTTGANDANFRLGFRNGVGTAINSEQAAITFDFAGARTAGIGFMRGATTDSLGITFDIGGTERVRITNVGRVGIGTDAPSYPLHVTYPGSTYASVENTVDATKLTLGATASVGNAIYSQTSAGGASPLTFIVGATRSMVLSTVGNVGFSTATPGATVQIGGDATYRELRLRRSLDAATANAITLYKTRGTEGGPTPVLSGDTLGSFIFAGHNETLAQGASITSTVDGTPGTTGIPGRLDFNTSAGSGPILRMRINSSGNVGMGIAPQAWGGTYRAIEFDGVSLFSGNAPGTGGFLATNTYHNGTAYTYKSNSAAANYAQVGGAHQWFNAPVGTTGATFSFTRAMTLTPASELLVNTSTSDGVNKLQVNGGAKIIGPASSTSFAARFCSGTYADGYSTLIGLGVEYGSFSKGAIGYTRTGSYDRGAILFCMNNAADGSNVAISDEKMRLDASGNLGLGVTPSGWLGSYKAIQIGSGAAFGSIANYSFISQNFVNDGSAKYINTGYASTYQQTNGQHRWLTAPSGTAGNAISFTQPMTLNASGRLLLNTTTDDGVNVAQFNGTVACTTPTAGDNSTKVATTAFVNQASSLSANGYQKLPSGLIIQWGTVTANASASNLPIAFPNAAFSAVGIATSTVNLDNLCLGTFTTTQISFTQFASNGTVKYIAIGY